MKNRRLFRSIVFLVVLIMLLISSVSTSSSQTSSLGIGNFQEYENLNLLILIKASQRSGHPVGSGVGAKTKLDIIKDALQFSLELNPFPPNANIGILVYGHRIGRAEYETSCSAENIELLLPLQPEAELGDITDLEIEGVGESPTTLALEIAGEILKQTSPTTRNVILLIADGTDSCNQNPEDVAKELEDEKNIVIYTIGFLSDTETNIELMNIAASEEKYSFVPSYLSTNDRVTEELTHVITNVFAELNSQIIPITLTPTDIIEVQETVTIISEPTETFSIPTLTEPPIRETPENIPTPTVTSESPFTLIGTTELLFGSAVILLGIFAFGFWFWRSRTNQIVTDRPIELERTIISDDDEILENFRKDIYKAYSPIGESSPGTKKYLPLETLKQKLSSKYSPEQFDEFLIQARRKYPNKIWIDKNSKGQTIVKINP